MFGWFKKATPVWAGYTFDGLVAVHAQLVRFRELPEATLVELLRVLSEFLIYSDQHSGEAFFFDFFCEKNMMALFVAIANSRSPSLRVQVQLLQTLSLLVQNISTATSLYYILSNNYVNKLLTCRQFRLDLEDVRDWYVTFLKAVSIRLTIDTVQFFFNAATRTFPLYVEALQFRHCAEIQVQIAVKTVILNVLRVPDDRMRRFLTQPSNLAYFLDLVKVNGSLALALQADATRLDRFQYKEDKLVDQWYYLQDILQVPMPDLCFRLGECLFDEYLQHLLARSLLPNCAANAAPRVSTLLALHLLTQFFQRSSHTPLLHATAVMLLHPELQGTTYMTAALGMGDKKVLGRTTSLDSNLGRHGSQDGASHLTPSLSSDSLRSNAVVLSPTASSRVSSPSPVSPPVVFEPHVDDDCSVDRCCLCTAFSIGDWPATDVRATAFDLTSNVYRQALLALVTSSQPTLRLATIALLRTILRHPSIDRSLLKDLMLLPRLAPRLSLPSSPVGAALGYDDDDDDDDDEEDDRPETKDDPRASFIDPSFPPVYDAVLVDGLLRDVAAPLHLQSLQITLDMLSHMTTSGSGRAPCWATTFGDRLESLLNQYQANVPDDIATWEATTSSTVTTRDKPADESAYEVQWSTLVAAKTSVSVSRVTLLVELLRTFDALHLLSPSQSVVPAIAALTTDQQEDTAVLRRHYTLREPLPLAERSFVPCVLAQADVYCLLNADLFVVVRPDARDRTMGLVTHLHPLHAVSIEDDETHLRVRPSGSDDSVRLEFPMPEMRDQMAMHLHAMRQQQVARKTDAIQTLLTLLVVV